LRVHLNHEDPEMGKVVLVIRETTAIAALVFLSIVEMARLALQFALQETQRRSIWREETKPREQPAPALADRSVLG
jgi:hypothetical protein